MFSLWGFFQFFYQSVLLWPGSFVVGLIAGYLFFRASGRPKTDVGAALWLILLVFSPMIGVSTWLIRVADIGIRANVFIYGLSLAVLIGYLIRDKIMHREKESGEPAGKSTM